MRVIVLRRIGRHIGGRHASDAVAVLGVVRMVPESCVDAGDHDALAGRPCPERRRETVGRRRARQLGDVSRKAEIEAVDWLRE